MRRCGYYSHRRLRKGTFSAMVCFPSTRTKTWQASTTREKFLFGEALQAVYPLLEIIFSYLPIEDLKSVLCVCEEWKKVAEAEISKRNFVSYAEIGTAFAINNCKNLHFSNAAVGIVLCVAKQCKLGDYVCVHPKNHQLTRRPCHDIQDIERMTFAEYIENNITGKIDHCVLHCPQMMSIFGDILQNTTDKKKYSTVEALMVPNIPNVKINTFHLTPNNRIIFQSDEIMKCLLIFSSTKCQTKQKKLFDSILQSQNREDLALAGGYINGLKSFIRSPTKPRYLPSTQLFCISFTQNRNLDADFNASSIVIEGNHLPAATFKESLVKLRNRSVLRTHSAAFLMCCHAKGKTRKEEPALFKSVFPDTPLLACDVNGEIGWDCFNDSTIVECESNVKKAKIVDKYLYEWSTAIVLLNWGKKL